MIDFNYSTASFPDRSLAAALDAIAAAGFAGIELFGVGDSFAGWRNRQGDEAPTTPMGGAVSDVRRQIETRGLRADTVHAPMRRTVLGAPDEPWRQQNVVVLGQFLRFAGDIGAKGVVIHGIPNPMFVPTDRPLAEYLQPMVLAMRRSVAELVPVAAQTGVRLLLENLPYQRDLSLEYPLIRMRQLSPFVREFPPEQVALVVDTGHAWTNGDDSVAEIRRAGGRLWGTHLQDVPREDPEDNHWVPTAGDLDWPGIIAELRCIGYRGAWTFEVSAHDGESPDELLRQSRAVAASWERSLALA